MIILGQNRCDSSLFENIDKVIVVFYTSDEAFSYRGTIRRVHYSNTEVNTALYKKEEINNREQQGYMLLAKVNILRYIKNGELTELDPPLPGKLLDISAHGARLQLTEKFLDVGDFIAFQLMDNVVKKLLLGKIVRIAADHEYDHQYGILLLENNAQKKQV